MNLLALLVLPMAVSDIESKSFAHCAAVMLAYYDSGSQDAWDEERAQALAAASYYVGRLEASVAEVHSEPALQRIAVRNFVNSESRKLDKNTIESEGKKCFADYTRAMPQ